MSDRSPGAELADIVVETGELDQSWCHTVGYLSPLVAATAVGAHIEGRAVDDAYRAAARELLQAGVDRAGIAEATAARLAEAPSIVVIASGADRTAGRELVLKIEEGTWVPAAYRDLETFLHGHLAATGEAMGLVLVLADRDARDARLARSIGALRAARGVGMEAAAIVAADAAVDLPTDLTPAGRVVSPEAPALPAPVAALLGTATPLQLLTERLARARGVDPDPIHRDVDRYREAAEAAGELTSDPADELLAHDVDHVEVPRDEVLEHDPLDAGRRRIARPGRGPRPASRRPSAVRRSSSHASPVSASAPNVASSVPLALARPRPASRPDEDAGHRRSCQRRRIAADRAARLVELRADLRGAASGDDELRLYSSA